VIKECSGISHRWVVGNNADGTYWSSDFMPNAQSLIGRLCCMGTVNFTANELTLNPTNLPSGFCIERHVPANQAATDEAKKLARDVSKCNKCSQRLYSPGLYDCRDWAKTIADTAENHQKNCKICNPDSGEKPKEGEK